MPATREGRHQVNRVIRSGTKGNGHAAKVVRVRTDGHVSLANSAALKESGVTTLNVTPLAETHADRVRLIERVRDLAA